MSADPDDGPEKLRRVYGKGFHDGMKAAAKEGDAEMNPEKIRRAEEGLTSVARKVYECVPIQEFWDASKVRGETKRRGMNFDVSTVGGCLESLKDVGLVRRGVTGYQRVSPPARPPTYPDEVQSELRAPAPRPADVVAMPVPVKGDTLSTLATLGREMRLTAERIIALSKEVDEAALAVEQRIAQINADAEKFRRLQELLQGIEK